MSTERPAFQPEELPRLETEAEQQAELAWLAGLCESGGSIYLHIQERADRDGYSNAYPYIAIQSRKTAVKEHLYARYQGADLKNEPGTWKLGGYKAAELIVAMKPWLSTRSEHLAAIENWLNTTDASERIEIAQDLKGYDRLETATIEEYILLLRNPAFVAGVIDNRGSIYRKKDSNWSHPAVSISTTNKELVAALHSIFGGSFVLEQPAGREVTIHNRAFQTKRDTYSVTVSAAKARRLIETTLPYLKIKPFEDWNTRLIDKRKISIEEEISHIQTFVESEITEYEAGQRFTLSTIEDIATEFSFTFRTAKRRLTHLPPELRKKREHIIRRTHNTALHPLQILETVQQILTEVAEYEIGERSSFTGNQELAEQLGVGPHIINRNIMSLVPKDAALLRQQVINSQTTAETNRRRAKEKHT